MSEKTAVIRLDKDNTTNYTGLADGTALSAAKLANMVLRIFWAEMIDAYMPDTIDPIQYEYQSEQFAKEFVKDLIGRHMDLSGAENTNKYLFVDKD